MLGHVTELSGLMVRFGVNLLVQSTVLLATGVAVAHCLGDRYATLQSAVLRMTFILFAFLPLAGVLLRHTAVDRPVTLTWTESSMCTVRSLPEREDWAAPETGTALILPVDDARPVDHTAVPGPSPDIDESPAVISAGPRFDQTAYLYLLFAGIWIALSSVHAVRLARSHMNVTALLREACPAGKALRGTAESTAVEMGIRPPEVYISTRIATPLVAGVVTPRLLLPPSVDSMSMAREIFIHEFAHLKRHDILWNISVSLSIFLLPFQPLLNYLARRMSDTNEYICDDHVLSRGTDRFQYARLLVDIAEYMHRYYSTVNVWLGAVLYRSILDLRVYRIVDSSRPIRVSAGKGHVSLSALMCAALASVSLLFGARAVPLFDGTAISPAFVRTVRQASREGVVDSEFPISESARGSDETLRESRVKTGASAGMVSPESGDVERLNVVAASLGPRTLPGFRTDYDPGVIPSPAVSTDVREPSREAPGRTVAADISSGFMAIDRETADGNQLIGDGDMMKLAYVWGDGFRPPEGLSVLGNLDAALRKFTAISADIDAPVRVASERLHSVPFLYVITDDIFDLTPVERENMGRYLRRGGLLFMESTTPLLEGSTSEVSFRNLIKNTLVSGVRFAPIPEDHPVFHCFFDIESVPAIQTNTGMIMMSDAQKLSVFNRDTIVKSMLMSSRKHSFEGAWLGEELVAVFSRLGYGVSRNFTLNDSQMKIAVNFMMYGLKRWSKMNGIAYFESTAGMQ